MDSTDTEAFTGDKHMNNFIKTTRKRRALNELLVASANLASNTELRSWAIEDEHTGQVWAAVQMLQDAVKEYDKYDD